MEGTPVSGAPSNQKPAHPAAIPAIRANPNKPAPNKPVLIAPSPVNIATPIHFRATRHEPPDKFLHSSFDKKLTLSLCILLRFRCL